MSLWWAQKNQLDEEQIALIEDLDLDKSHLILGPPGCGKTNILLRRARFVRPQGYGRVLVLTFTRALTEFIKTGCVGISGTEVFPINSISTYEGWIRALYKEHKSERPMKAGLKLNAYKSALAEQALSFVSLGKLPRYDCLFVDEAQDLLPNEIELLRSWSDIIFAVGDSRQKIFDG